MRKISDSPLASPQWLPLTGPASLLTAGAASAAAALAARAGMRGEYGLTVALAAAVMAFCAAALGYALAWTLAVGAEYRARRAQAGDSDG